MRRITAGVCLIAGLLATTGASVRSEEQTADSALLDQQALPLATDVKGQRPRVDPTAVTPAATELPEPLQPLKAPPPLALPDQPEQVRIHALRPLTYEESLQIAEVNSPSLKAAASQVDQAKSALRAAISAWYPTVDLSANGLPQYLKSYTFRNPDFTRQTIPAVTGPFGQEISPERTVDGQNEFYSKQWRADANVSVSWNIIDPSRVPAIAAARDRFEQSRDAYLIALRDLRLDTSTAYFSLQEADEAVRIGQASVRASLISLRDARARYNAGVNTKLDVLEAETQLADDRKLLADALARQSFSRRNLASSLALPQDITPTAATPARPLGLWEASLQESIVAAYNYREELDQLILDISINNSEANASLAAVQPVLSFVNTTSTFREDGQGGEKSWSAIDLADYRWGVDNATALQAKWRLFDGGRARANYKRSKQAAEESRQRFAVSRNRIRLEVEESFINQRKEIQNIETTSSRVLTAREALRLSQLRVQAGVSTQREVVDNQRDLTRAELAYAQAINLYNTSLAQLRRRTGLDALQICTPISLSGTKPETTGPSIPIEPTPLPTVCPVGALATVESSPVQPLW
ncbi:MAG: TolC family protein [Synechococcus sp.]